jgi:hypothetical protein
MEAVDIKYAKQKIAAHRPGQLASLAVIERISKMANATGLVRQFGPALEQGRSNGGILLNGLGERLSRTTELVGQLDRVRADGQRVNAQQRAADVCVGNQRPCMNHCLSHLLDAIHTVPVDDSVEERKIRELLHWRL